MLKINTSVNKLTILISTTAISIVFLIMIKSFLVTILLAGLFAALIYPLYSKILSKLKGKEVLASLITVFSVFVILFILFIIFIGLIVSQAIKVSKSVNPWVSNYINKPDELSLYFKKLPFYESILEYRSIIFEKAGEIINSISNVFVEGLSSSAMITLNFIFLFIIMLFSTFYFLIDGKKLLRKILLYLPLEDNDEKRLLGRFSSVTIATVKGTFIIGVVQGTLAGIAFYVAGFSGALFWATIMAVLSIIPGIGSALIWGPATIILLIEANYLKGMGLFIFCALVVGSIDNFLRPLLVSKNAKLHELMIILSTLGGIQLFGIAGVLLGPIIAALFVTLWDLYGVAFKEHLPKVDL